MKNKKKLMMLLALILIGLLFLALLITPLGLQIINGLLGQLNSVTGGGNENTGGESSEDNGDGDGGDNTNNYSIMLDMSPEILPRGSLDGVNITSNMPTTSMTLQAQYVGEQNWNPMMGIVTNGIGGYTGYLSTTTIAGVYNFRATAQGVYSNIEQVTIDGISLDVRGNDPPWNWELEFEVRGTYYNWIVFFWYRDPDTQSYWTLFMYWLTDNIGRIDYGTTGYYENATDLNWYPISDFPIDISVFLDPGIPYEFLATVHKKESFIWLEGSPYQVEGDIPSPDGWGCDTVYVVKSNVVYIETNAN